MKSTVKTLFALVLTLCLLIVPFAASAEGVAPLNLMPADESGYTIVEGDGTVAITDGKLILTNNGDGDFRVLINNYAEFDLSTLTTLHMSFKADMPFKMAYHVGSHADSADDWVTTTTDFNDLYEIDVATDRNPAGDYNLNMDLDTVSVALVDKTAVYFEQFIILVTGKGTFTLDAVEMTETKDAPATDDPVTEAPAEDEPPADTEEPEQEPDTATTTTTKKTTSSAGNTAMPLWLPIILIVVVVVVAAVCIIIIVKRNKA